MDVSMVLEIVALVLHIIGIVFSFVFEKQKAENKKIKIAIEMISIVAVVLAATLLIIRVVAE